VEPDDRNALLACHDDRFLRHAPCLLLKGSVRGLYLPSHPSASLLCSRAPCSTRRKREQAGGPMGAMDKLVRGIALGGRSIDQASFDARVECAATGLDALGVG